jgi:hypothetical protein
LGTQSKGPRPCPSPLQSDLQLILLPAFAFSCTNRHLRRRVRTRPRLHTQSTAAGRHGSSRPGTKLERHGIEWVQRWRFDHWNGSGTVTLDQQVGESATTTAEGEVAGIRRFHCGSSPIQVTPCAYCALLLLETLCALSLSSPSEYVRSSSKHACFSCSHTHSIIHRPCQL